MGVGDTFKMTLSLNNGKNLVSGAYGLSYDGTIFTFKNVKLNQAAVKYANQNGLETVVNEPVLKGSGASSSVTVGASFNKDGYAGLDGDMPFLDITFKVTGDEWYSDFIDVKVTTSNYTKAGATKTTTLPYYSQANFELISKHTKIEGSIRPEASVNKLNVGYSLKSRDYTKIGVEVYALSPSGQKYKGTIASNGKFTILGVPVSDKQ